MSKAPRTSKKSSSTKPKKISKTKKEVKHWNIDDSAPDEYAGFVYVITNLMNGRKYVGRKYFWSTTRVKQTGKKRRKVVTKQSNWRSYTGSNVELNKDIKTHGVKLFEFEVVGLFKTKAEVNYAEVKEQFICDVLHSVLDNGEYAYYNSNILGKYYRSNTCGN